MNTSFPQLTGIILTDRADQIFLAALKSLSFANKILIFDYQSGNNWSLLTQKLQLKPQQLEIKTCPGKIVDFAQARNQAIKMVKTEWLLFLDSDEILQPFDLYTLHQELANKQVVAYHLKRIDVFHQQKLHFGETNHSHPLRLARTKEIHFIRQVHEEALIEKKHNSIMTSSLQIQHYSHRDISQFLTAISDYAELEADYRQKEAWVYSKFRLALEFICLPPLKFLYNYFWRLGFLDGFAGLVYAYLMSLHSLFLRVFIYEKYFL